MSIVEMSVAGGAVILAAVLIRALGRDRLPRQTFTALWALAVLRLTVPAALPFRLSAWTVIRKAVPRTAAPVPAAVTISGQPAVSAVDIIQNSALLPGRSAPFPTATVLWLAGMALLALVLAVQYIRACRRFRGAQAVDNCYVNQSLAEHPLRRTVQVRASDRIAAPLTYGVLRPVILLPEGLDRNDAQTLRYVLAHELAHIRRFDAVRKLILAAVLCLHWFNPLVWVMFALAGRDMERACDEAVLRGSDTDIRKAYAHILLDMEQVRDGFTGFASGFSKTVTEERIRSIMKIRKRSFLSAALAAVLVLGTGALFATAAPEPEAGQESRDVLANAGTGLIDQENDGTVHTAAEDVQWWTAEEYAVWLEQEKKDLQDCLGQRAWTRSDGWFTWTQEKINETIKMYEQVLTEIESGMKISKPLADGALLYEGADTAVQFSRGGDTEDVPAAAQTEGDTSLTEQLDQMDQALAPYAPFGVTCQYNEDTDDVELYWNSRRIRGIYDGVMGVWITAHEGDGTWPEGTPELIAVYTDGVLSGLRPATEAEQEQWTEGREQIARFGALTDHLTAILSGDEDAAEGWTDLCRALERDGELTVDLGRLDAGSAVIAVSYRVSPPEA